MWKKILNQCSCFERSKTYWDKKKKEEEDMRNKVDWKLHRNVLKEVGWILYAIINTLKR